MTLKNGKRTIVANTLAAVPKGPGPENQFIQLRPALHGREVDVLKAVAALPAEIRTPSAAASELVRRGIGIPYSTVGSILRRLERKGALRLGRVKP
jgi:DNA-binding transcriptional ArsR family regulator